MSPFRSSKTRNLGKNLEIFESRKIGAANLQDADKEWPGGLPPAEWLSLQSGDSYEGGIIYKVDATTYQLWYYPESRTTGGIASNSTPISGTFTVDQQTQIKVYGVGGGGGGRGENSHAGGGGGAFTTDYFDVGNGEQFSYTVGAGGRGGVSSYTSTSVPYLGDSNNDSTAGGDTTFTAVAGNLVLSATGGGVGNNVTNTSSSPDLGAGGTGSIPNNARSIAMVPGTGGTGGGRNFQAGNGTAGGAGGGGGNSSGSTGPNSNIPLWDKGGNGSGSFGGGGGAGNAPGGPGPSLRPGGSAPGTYAYDGGDGGRTDAPATYGQNGDDMRGKVGFPNAFYGGAGFALQASNFPLPGGYPGGSLVGGGGGGGFAGGGGGSSWYNPGGVGADGASGVLVIEWTTT